ncbi:MAG: protein kinase [Nocardiopsaceae bacterium]|nr:protein kinase [Nocardiopsaceae bacterium]
MAGRRYGVPADFPPAGAGQQPAGLGLGTLIGGYRLEGRIGAGGMATVFRARDEALGRLVALKVLGPAAAADEKFRERFVRESQAASLVDHPNIIPVYAAGEQDGILYLAMRFVSGGDLHSVVEREGPLTPTRAIALLYPVASALDTAHRAGIVHRDVKPANVLIDMSPGRPDHPYLSDFGLAKRDVMATMTRAGEFVGTTSYAAPEQIAGRSPRPESDQYALACVTFTLLTARLPFAHSSPEAVLWAQMSQPPPRVTPMRPDLPAVVDDVLARALAKEPLDRFPSCVDFVHVLAQALAGDPLASEPSASGAWSGSPPDRSGSRHPSFPVPGPSHVPPELAPEKPKRSRRPVIAAVAGATAVIAAAAVVGMIMLDKPSAPAGSKPGAPGGRGTTRQEAGGGPKISARRVAVLGDPRNATVLGAAFGSGGKLRILDSNDIAYTFSLGSRKVVNRSVLGSYGPYGTQFSLDGEALAAPDSNCVQGGSGPCAYQLFWFGVPDLGNEWNGTLDAGPGSGVALGDYTMVVSGTDGYGIRVLNLRTLAAPLNVTNPGHRDAGALALSPDGGTAAAVAAGTGPVRHVYVWHLAEPSAPPAVINIPSGLGVSKPSASEAGMPLALAGSTLAASDGVTTNVYNLASRRRTATVPAGLLGISPVGPLLATADQQNSATVDLRDAATGKLVATLAIPGEHEPPSAVTFSADGRSLAIGYADGKTYVWHLTGS